MTVTNCPSCGGQIQFAIGSSAVVVCEYCRSVVARGDRKPEDLGKVAAIIETDSRLRRGGTGRCRGVGFQLTGRTQMKHPSGGVWNEWYAAFDNGRWGWIAEAQGKFYLTFASPKVKPPPISALRIGKAVPEVAGMVVYEIAEAEMVAAEGEIPWRFEPGGQYEYADLSGEEGKFATIDYSEEPPLVFAGREVEFEELGLDGSGARPAEKQVKGIALSCANCGGRLDLVAPDQAERVICPNCGGAHDTTQGKLRFLHVLKRKKVEPQIPLGRRCKFYGDEYVVAGFMQRSVHFDIHYYWTEYLLYNEKRGFRWLVQSDDHWSFVRPVPAGEVTDSGEHVEETPANIEVAKTISWRGKSFKIYQTAMAKVEFVVGEFYWRVEEGEEVATADYIAPPEGLSKEVTTGESREINYSHAKYLTPEEVEESAGVTGLPRPAGVGTMQPFPGPNLLLPWAWFVAALFVLAILFAVTSPNRVVLKESYDLTAPLGTTDPEVPAGATSRVIFTPSFELTGRRNLVIEGSSAVSNSWVYVDGDLVNEGSGALETFDLPIEYYSGSDGGESWSEGNQKRRVSLSSMPKGKYALRLEAQWPPGASPPFLHVQIREGVFRIPHLIRAFLILSIIPLIMLIRYLVWESSRWADSDFSPYKSASAGDDEDDE